MNIGMSLKLFYKLNCKSRERKKTLKRFELLQEHRKSQRRKDQEFDRFIMLKLQHESSLLKQNLIIDFSLPKDFDAKK